MAVRTHNSKRKKNVLSLTMKLINKRTHKIIDIVCNIVCNSVLYHSLYNVNCYEIICVQGA